MHDHHLDGFLDVSCSFGRYGHGLRALARLRVSATYNVHRLIIHPNNSSIATVMKQLIDGVQLKMLGDNRRALPTRFCASSWRRFAVIASARHETRHDLWLDDDGR